MSNSLENLSVEEAELLIKLQTQFEITFGDGTGTTGADMIRLVAPYITQSRNQILDAVLEAGPKDPKVWFGPNDYTRGQLDANNAWRTTINKYRKGDV